MGIKHQVVKKHCALYNADCCEVMPSLPDESVDFVIFSPPFGDLYSYSDDLEDMSNAESYDQFFDHFSFLIGELYRVLTPGRIVAVHCMDLPIFKRDGGMIGLREFPDDIVKAFKNVGFAYHSHHVIWKDPLIAATRTKAIGLAHKQLVKDSSVVRAGIPDEIVAFRKPGENPKPIQHPNSLTIYHGSRSIPKNLDRFITEENPKLNKRSHWIWQQYASPVWFDINQTEVLPYRKGRDKDDTKHICPLQLQVIERCMLLWSREGDTVLTPFMGVGSEVFVAVQRRRKAIGIELKTSYYRQAVRNVKQARKLSKNGEGAGLLGD